MRTRTLTLLILPLLSTACMTATTSTRTWTADSGGYQAWQRRGWVDQVRETVQRTQGNPAGGAVAGAVVGGLLGTMLSSHTHYDRWGRAHSHANPAGTVVGAVGGAVVGAAASQGGGELRTYEVWVRFDDGGYQAFTYRDASPFRPGDWVVQTEGGLQPLQR
ncbi:MAG: hypothetical protein QM767_18335 [Anaeromyxobacter sp.]